MKLWKVSACELREKFKIEFFCYSKAQEGDYQMDLIEFTREQDAFILVCRHLKFPDLLNLANISTGMRRSVRAVSRFIIQEPVKIQETRNTLEVVRYLVSIFPDIPLSLVSLNPTRNHTSGFKKYTKNFRKLFIRFGDVNLNYFKQAEDITLHNCGTITGLGSLENVKSIRICEYGKSIDVSALTRADFVEITEYKTISCRALSKLHNVGELVLSYIDRMDLSAFKDIPRLTLKEFHSRRHTFPTNEVDISCLTGVYALTIDISNIVGFDALRNLQELEVSFCCPDYRPRNFEILKHIPHIKINDRTGLFNTENLMQLNGGAVISLNIIDSYSRSPIVATQGTFLTFRALNAGIESYSLTPRSHQLHLLVGGSRFKSHYNSATYPTHSISQYDYHNDFAVEKLMNIAMFDIDIDGKKVKLPRIFWERQLFAPLYND